MQHKNNQNTCQGQRSGKQRRGKKEKFGKVRIKRKNAANEGWLALFKRDGGKVEQTDSVGVNFRIIKFLF